MVTEIERTVWTGRLRKIWREYVKDDTRSFDQFHEDAQYKDDWRMRIEGAAG